MQILLVEDDVEAARHVLQGLERGGYAAELATDGRSGLSRALAGQFDLLIVDRMLPYLDGLSIVTTLRHSGSRTPVLMLSALGTVGDRVDGLRAGGDDYLIKPFAFMELLARVEALLRRHALEGTAPPVLRVGDLELNALARRVMRAGREITLTAKEFQLLEFLMSRAGQVVTRTMLLEAVWNLHFDPQTNLIDVHMSRLRAAVDRGFERPLLHTVRGAGYLVREAVAAVAAVEST
ncbi:MAG TPA: winged helix-turn-helix domain-containing protein [Steroidobacteraceae bacterium]|jgi:two-component system OmpR family response regulator|nr:winged helix-turn-helix domain-containing protein [Steroidobacteraceae bacterium]